MWEKLKTLGWGVLGIVLFVVIGSLGLLFIYGGAWLGAKVYPWLVSISALAFSVVIFVLLPLAIFRKTRAFAGTGMVFSSYLFGLTLWIWALLLTLELWGGVAVIIGLFFAGVGVVPLAMLATLFKGMWGTLGELFLLLVLTFGARSAGFFFCMKAEEQ